MNNPHDRRRLLVGTTALLAAAFFVLILLFLIFSYFIPMFTGKCVAVVDVNYPLTIEGSPTTFTGAGYPSSEELSTKIKELDSRPEVGSVLFVVNSPGGSDIASQEVYKSVKGLNKPKVAYFREVAASGAYLVATGTDYIVSEPHALTGSIGVVMTFTSMGGLFEKLGVNMTAITSGQYKDTGSPARNLNPDEIRMMQAIVDEVFQDFKSAVIQNRGKRLNLQKFNEVADGRIMTGKQAKEIGLVDALGDKNDALVKAAKLGGMDAENPEDVRVCPVEVYPRETSLISLNSFVSSVNEKFQSVGLYLR